MNYTIALVVAMKAEALAIANRLSLDSLSDELIPYHFQRYESSRSNVPVSLFTNGIHPKYKVEQVGTQPAAILADFVLRTFKPNILINAGTAGAFASDGAHIGDVYLGYPEIVFHDRRIPLPTFEDYGVGHFPAPTLCALATLTESKTGVVSTGNSLDHTQVDLLVMRKNRGLIKDMEAASHAFVAQMHGIPFVAVKAITDLIDRSAPTEDQFIANLELASQRLAEKVFRIVNTLLHHPNARPMS